MNICKQTTGERIRRALEARNIRPAELAGRLGVSRAAVSNWLRGEKLSATHISAIATELDVSINWLTLGIGSIDIAADATLSPREEDMIRLVRYFGDDILQRAVSMVTALSQHMSQQERQPLRQFKAYDMVAHTQMPIAVLDAGGHLVFSNIYHNQLLGMNEDEARSLQGRHFTDWIPKIFHRKFRSILEDTLRQGHATYSNMHLICPVTQQERKLIIHAHAVSTPAGPGAQLLFKPFDHATPA